MNEQQQSASPGGERVYERCICREAMDRWMDLFGVRSQTVRQHLRNSRVEFLKAVRTVIDDRIAHLSAKGSQQGTTVNVE
jgi:hypothetical protein